jgi:hypothetical protein
MSRTSKLLLGVLASMMVWSLVGADELDLAKQQDRAGFGPAARQVVDAQALQSVGACCRAETDAAVAAAVAAVADVAAVAAAADAAVVVAEKASAVALAVQTPLTGCLNCDCAAYTVKM